MPNLSAILSPCSTLSTSYSPTRLKCPSSSLPMIRPANPALCASMRRPRSRCGSNSSKARIDLQRTNSLCTSAAGNGVVVTVRKIETSVLSNPYSTARSNASPRYATAAPTATIPRPPGCSANSREFSLISCMTSLAFSRRAITFRCCVIQIAAPALVYLAMFRSRIGVRSAGGSGSSICRAVLALAIEVTNLIRTGVFTRSERSKATCANR